MMKNKTRKDYIKKLDSVFSEYIRLRDSDSRGIVVCPLCKKRLFWKKAQNMHFISRGVLRYRFNEQNCHAGCMRCNVILNGNYIQYTIRMINTYGKNIVNEMINNKRPYELRTAEIIKMIHHYENKRDFLLRGKRFYIQEKRDEQGN